MLRHMLEWLERRLDVGYMQPACRLQSRDPAGRPAVTCLPPEYHDHSSGHSKLQLLVGHGHDGTPL
jgi:hypothetical protein